MKSCIEFHFISFSFLKKNVFHCMQTHYQIFFSLTLPILSKLCYTFLTICNLLLKRYEFIFIKMFSICTHHWKHDTQGSDFFRIIFAPSKKFQTILGRKNIVIYCYSITLYIKYWKKVFVLVKCVFFNLNIIKYYNFFTHVIYDNIVFISLVLTPIFSVKLEFCNIPTASLFLLIIQWQSIWGMFKIARLLRLIDINNTLWHQLQTYGWNFCYKF